MFPGLTMNRTSLDPYEISMRGGGGRKISFEPGGRSALEDAGA